MKRFIVFLLYCLFVQTVHAADTPPSYKTLPSLGWSLDQVLDGTNAGTITGQTIALEGTICNGLFLTTDANGNVECASGGSGTGTITGVAAGAGLTGGGTSGNVTVTVGEGLAIDANADDVAFDPTELTGSRTWGDGSTDTIVWTWNRATGTDPTLTMGSGTITGQAVAYTSLNCTTYGNGGVLTTDANGNVKCDNDDLGAGGGGSGAPTDADYLVGTANGSLSAEIVVGTTPGGELGNTWASPTLDDSVTVTGWVMGASTATTPSANDDDTSLATTAYVQTELTGEFQVTLLPQQAVLDDSAPPDFTIVESTGTGTPRRWVADFDPTTDQILYWSFTLPTNIIAGNWSLDVNWFTNDTGANEDAIWAADLSCTTEGDADSMAEDAAGASNTASENCNATEANRLIQTTITLSNTDSAAAGDFCTLRVFRDADDSVGDADNDGLTSDARLLSVRLRAPRTL